MKKIASVIVVIILISVLVSCINGEVTGGDNNVTDVNGGTSAPETQELVLVNNDIVKVTFVEIFELPELANTCYLRLRIENKSDKTVMVSIKDSYVNDTTQMIGSGVPMTLAPGKSSQTPFFFGYGNLGINSKDEIDKIEFKVWLIDNENYDTVFETDLLLVDFNK